MGYLPTSAKLPRVRVIFDRKKVTAKNKNKKGLIEIEVYFNGTRTLFSTRVRVYPDQWKKDMVIRGFDAIELNKAIAVIKNLLQDEVNRQMKETETLDFGKLREIFTKHEDKDKPATPDFLLFMQKRINERPMAEGTWRQHRSVFNRLKEWGKIQTFEDLTLGAVKAWDEHSRKFSEGGERIETWHKVLRIYIRELMAFATDPKQGINLPKDFRCPYDLFTVKRDLEIKHAFLTQEELSTWCEVKLPTKQAEAARDLFIFGCYTGLAFADLQAFDPRLIYKQDGGLRYSARRIKTKEAFSITILKPAERVLDKYGGELPRMDAHVYNRYLKDIACLCGISKKISSHCSRVTFASTVCLANNVPLVVTSSAMGHKGSLQTSRYTRLTQSLQNREFDRINATL